MKILYISCHAKKILDMYNKENRQQSSIVISSEIFNRKIVTGLVECGCDVDVLVTTVPVFLDNSHPLNLYKENELSIFYPPRVHGKYSQRLVTTFWLAIFLREWKKKYPNGVLVCDYLKPNLLPIYLLGYPLCVISIITDLPKGFLQSQKESIGLKWQLRKYNFIIRAKKTCGFVLLAEKMKEIIPIGNKHYIVIDGIVNSEKNDNFANKVRNFEEKKWQCMYSGCLHKRYGIDLLIEGFRLANIPNSELLICGFGDYEKQIKKISKLDNRIIYFGVIPNNEVLELQHLVNLLVNPRPSKQEFVLYSFPSKNLEYMASGTPVLTTNLPTMKSDLRENVFTINDETAMGIAKELKKIYCVDELGLHEFGRRAQDYVLKTRNEMVQAQKIINLIKYCRGDSC